MFAWRLGVISNQNQFASGGSIKEGGSGILDYFLLSSEWAEYTKIPSIKRIEEMR